MTLAAVNSDSARQPCSFDGIAGRRGLVVGIANSMSIAFGCAEALREAGAELAVTWLNSKAEAVVKPLAEELGASLMMPLDVRDERQLEAVFGTLTQAWGHLDFLVHSIAHCPKADLRGRAVDCSLAGFQEAMLVSCWSFLRMAKLAEPLMTRGGTLITVSYEGSERVIPGYGIMGPVKAALEAVVRQLAAELGRCNIRVVAVSPGPVPTRAASGIPDFDTLLASALAKAPLGRLPSIREIGRTVAFLAGPAASAITGEVIRVDGGVSRVTRCAASPAVQGGEG